MPSQADFIKNQDRTYFNQYRPIQPNYAGYWPQYNEMGPLEPVEEVQRQTGNGRFHTMPVPFHGSGPIFSSPLANNWDASKKPPKTGIYKGNFNSNFNNLEHHPIPRVERRVQIGGSGYEPLRPGNYLSNPMINNWLPGAMMPIPDREKMRMDSQTRYITTPPIPTMQNGPWSIRKDLWDAPLNSDNLKPFSSTAPYYNTGIFTHVNLRDNPRIIK